MFVNLPDNWLPVVVALMSVGGFFVQAYLNRKERRETREREAAEKRDIVAGTLRNDYDRIKKERDSCLEEVRYLRNLLRRNGAGLKKGE